MRSTPARSALLLGAALLAAGCAAQPGSAAAPSSPSPSAGQDGPKLPDGGALVLRVAYVGGFVPAEFTVTRLPLVSVYADGRVITEGPVAAIYPGPALPNVLESHLDPARVEEYVQRALDAGVGEDVDYGRPNVTDVPSTLFTVVTADGTKTSEVYALQPGLFPEGDDGGITDRQAAAREPLRQLLEDLTGAASDGQEPYEPEAIAAVVRGSGDSGSLPESEVVAWPGPPLPGEPLGEGLGLTCVTARGEATDAVLEAAAGADAATSWTAADGSGWSLALRPLLPDEAGCEDLGPR